MIPAEIPKLQQALQDKYPGRRVWAAEATHTQLQMVVREPDGTPYILVTPQTMDYRALDWKEWMHRATAAFAEKGL